MDLTYQCSMPWRFFASGVERFGLQVHSKTLLTGMFDLSFCCGSGAIRLPVQMSVFKLFLLYIQFHGVFNDKSSAWFYSD